MSARSRRPAKADRAGTDGQPTSPRISPAIEQDGQQDGRAGSSTRYRALVESALDAIIGMDDAGRIVEFNAAAERTFGYTRAQALGQLVADLLVPPDYRERHTQAVARYVATGVGMTLGKRQRFSALRADGAEFPIELSVVRLPAEGATPAQFQAYIRDLTDLRREEEQRALALAEAEAARVAADTQASELEATFEAMSDAVLVYDLDLRIIRSNQATYALFEFERELQFTQLGVAERIARTPVFDANGRQLSVEDLPQSRALRGETLTQAHATDLRIRVRADREIEVSCSATPLRDPDGAIVGAVAVYRDITERRRLEQELAFRARAQEAVNARLHTVLDVLPVGVFIADARGAFTEVNAMGRMIWGESAPMLRSLDEYGTYVGWWPDTGKRIQPEEWALARSLRTGEYISGEEIRIQAFDGQIKTVLDSTAPIYDASGAIVGGVVTLMDMTERRQLTERTRRALDGFLAITQSLVGAEAPAEDESAETLDSPQRQSITWRLAQLTRGVLGCSRVAISAFEGERLIMRQLAIVGLTAEEEREWLAERSQLPEQRAAETLPPDLLAQLWAGELVVLDMTQPPYNSQPNRYGTTTALVAPMLIEGRLVGVLVLDYLEQDADGRTRRHQFTQEETQLTEAVARLGAVVLERERLLREREVAQAHALALGEANRRMDEFIGIAGHELRTPLTSVKANIQLAERRARSLAAFIADLPATERGARNDVARLVHLLTNSVNGVERQERLVRDLLDISRISSGKLAYRMEPSELSALIREMTQELRLSAPEREITLTLPASGVLVMADTDRIGQALTNYLTNALRYAPPDRPVAVSLRTEPAAAPTTARVEVTDQGPGLAPTQLEGLFERFHQVEGIAALGGSGVGLGLGLYITREIVARHGGEVGVESEPGQGATFWFTLPLLPAEG